MNAVSLSCCPVTQQSVDFIIVLSVPTHLFDAGRRLSASSPPSARPTPANKQEVISLGCLPPLCLLMCTVSLQTAATGA